MRSTKIIHVVSAHAEGEVGDVIVGGVAPPPGNTVWEQRKWIAEDESLRRFLLNEPRGGVFRHVNLLIPPKHPNADAAWIIMEPEDTPPMSGSNSMCVATVLLETGLHPMTEPTTDLTMEAPGGLVHATARCRDGKVEQITVVNLPSFAVTLGAELVVEGLGTLTVDTAFGGDSFVVVDTTEISLAMIPENAREIAELGVRITQAANDQLPFKHPTQPDWTHHSFCLFAGPVARDGNVLTASSVVAIQPGKLDRSPCGTGVSARMALLAARNEMSSDDRFVAHSIIGSTFEGRIVGHTQVGNTSAIRPTISGRAWITGTHQHMCDPDDPWPEGYRLSDTWPKKQM